MLVGNIGLSLLITRVANGYLPSDGTFDTTQLPHPCQNYFMYITPRSSCSLYIFFYFKVSCNVMVNSAWPDVPIHCELRTWYQLSARINSRTSVCSNLPSLLFLNLNSEKSYSTVPQVSSFNCSHLQISALFGSRALYLRNWSQAFS